MSGKNALERIIADECIANDQDVEVLRRALAIYEAVLPLVDTTVAITQLEWNGVMSRLANAVAKFDRSELR